MHLKSKFSEMTYHVIALIMNVINYRVIALIMNVIKERKSFEENNRLIDN